ncbi:MAG: CpsD/CapB family tyrosine-protein kinase [Bdellovibrionota bacterium]
MSVVQLKDSGQLSAPGSDSQSSSAAVDGRSVKRAAPKGDASALHEGGIVLSGGRTVDFQAAERFRILRAKIERMNLTDPARHLIAVTSAVPEEGKSLVAANLARALAMDPRGKTLLIDCDLRKPAVHRYFGIPFAPGLSDALVGTRPVVSVIQSIESGLDIIPSGSPVIDATRAVELPQLQTMLAELRRHYRYIVLDCPPVLLCPEPLTISSLVDGTLLVVRAWKTHKKLVRDAVGAIGKEKFIGVIVNDARDALNEYGYYGYYGYDYRGSSRTKKKAGGKGDSSGGKHAGLVDRVAKTGNESRMVRLGAMMLRGIGGCTLGVLRLFGGLAARLFRRSRKAQAAVS